MGHGCCGQCCARRSSATTTSRHKPADREVRVEALAHHVRAVNEVAIVLGIDPNATPIAIRRTFIWGAGWKRGWIWIGIVPVITLATDIAVISRIEEILNIGNDVKRAIAMWT